MTQMFVQGDLLIERVPDIPPSGTVHAADLSGALVLAEGETTGHRHVIYDQVLMFRDEALARDIPNELYVAHVQVDSTAFLRHDEHTPIELEKGTYRVSRQRELEPRDVHMISD
jgi:hypothetical protein